MIGKARQERLWKHLMEFQDQVGSLKEPDIEAVKLCPIVNCAPTYDKDGNVNRGCDEWGDHAMVYGETRYHCVYTKDDTSWWVKLSISTREQVTGWIQGKLKEGTDAAHNICQG